ncbi:MAG: hypothetical protein CMH60_04175 [Myxococcales bacterium]|nr:hypothetical protein [Myxococcales bacterium]|tara:strand:+ start:503 stop:1474 length:972 start_codon:yes stop_codon:yes gene_type:complete
MDSPKSTSDQETEPSTQGSGRVIVRFRVTGQKNELRNDISELRPQQQIIVDTEKGEELATVLTTDIPKSELEPKYKTLRLLDDQDQDTITRHSKREQEAKHYCKELITEHKLNMKLVDVEFSHSGKRAIFYFTSANRIDFRALVKDLAKRFHTRIEMRQIGVRDAARHTGGLGICGRELCCSTWLPSFKPISLRLAKTQNLALNQQKLSGVCGRLRCCLSYEQDTYLELKKHLPKTGKQVHTPEGQGKVIDISIFKQEVKVELRNGSFASFTASDVKSLSQDEIKQTNQAKQQAVAQDASNSKTGNKTGKYRNKRRRFKGKDK